MRYIKLFENHKDYVEIPKDDWTRLKFESEHFSISELSSIPLKFTKEEIEVIAKDLYSYSIPRNKKIRLRMTYEEKILLYKIEDDYYIVWAATDTIWSIYKCDQLHGFKQLLTDLNLV